MTGTPSQRKRSSQLLALLLLALAAAAAVAAWLPWGFGVVDPVRPDFLSAAFAACGLVALTGSALELARHRSAEGFALAAAILGTPLTWSAMSNAWFAFAPLFGVLELGVFLSLAYRYAVRSEERHRSRRSLGA